MFPFSILFFKSRNPAIRRVLFTCCAKKILSDHMEPEMSESLPAYPYCISVSRLNKFYIISGFSTGNHYWLGRLPTLFDLRYARSRINHRVNSTINLTEWCTLKSSFCFRSHSSSISIYPSFHQSIIIFILVTIGDLL